MSEQVGAISEGDADEVKLIFVPRKNKDVHSTSALSETSATIKLQHLNKKVYLYTDTYKG